MTNGIHLPGLDGGTMTRLSALIVIATLIGCGGEEAVETDPGGGPTGCANNPEADVPEEFRCLWEVNYDGCTTSKGRQGRQLYWKMTGEVDAEGNITGEEQIWWFFPEEWKTPDCTDVLSIEGQALQTDLEQLGCGTCEEGYETRRAVTENTCNLGYNLLFEEDSTGLKQTLLFDTKTSNGDPNEDNKILVLHRTKDRQSGALKTEEYARGNMQPLGETHGAPYSFTWLGSACQER